MHPVVNQHEITYTSYGIDLQGIFQHILGANYQSVAAMLSTFWDVFSIVAVIISILFFLVYVYAKIRYEQLGELQLQQLHDAEVAWAHTYGTAQKKNSRWGDILSHVASHSPNDWRIAIIEADILLEETLERAGYVGTSVADRLKAAAHSPFDTLQDAWEAHKVRNRIAHVGGDFVLTKKIAQETITRYERVFREFNVA
jgi:hypothetical protein